LNFQKVWALSILGGIKKLGIAALLFCAVLPAVDNSLNFMLGRRTSCSSKASLALDGTPRIELTAGMKESTAPEAVHPPAFCSDRVPFDRSFGKRAGPLFVIQCSGPGLKVQAPGRKKTSYHLSVRQSGIKLTAPSPLASCTAADPSAAMFRPAQRMGHPRR